jgi:hypothetical protein
MVIKHQNPTNAYFHEILSLEVGMAIRIYAFFYFEGAEKRCFYVGRSKDLTRRMREHHYSKRKGHEDKYVGIRRLEATGMQWETEVIESLPDDEYFPDAERWHVIRLTREGHELMNMRHGSVAHRKELAEQIRSRHIRSAADVITDRKKRRFNSARNYIARFGFRN